MRTISRALWWMSVALATAGAGCSGANCPSDYPVERDGFCYRADDADAGGGGADGGGMDAGSGGTDAGSGGTDAGEAVDGGGGGTDAGPVDAGPVDGALSICSGTHPLVMGTRRYCESGDCYCGDPENCFPEAIAEACCNVDVVCDDDDGGAPTDGGGVICLGTHPLVDGTRRYCESGDCYCADPDSCFPSVIASACCGGAVVCE